MVYIKLILNIIYYKNFKCNTTFTMVIKTYGSPNERDLFVGKTFKLMLAT